MWIRYNCPVCGSVHNVETGDAEAVKAINLAIDQAVSKFATSVMQTLNSQMKRVGKETRSKGFRPVVSYTELKKACKELVQINKGAMLNNIDGVICGAPKMIGALIVTHADGKITRLIAESGDTDIFGKGSVVIDGWKAVNKVYITTELTSLFSGKSITRSAYFPTMPDNDFTTNCAAMKLLLAVARDRQSIRDGAGKRAFLESDAEISALNLSEILYRPPGVKLNQGFRQFASTFEYVDDDMLPKADFVAESEEELAMEMQHFARPCDRCRLKVPAIICPLTSRTDKSVLPEAARFMA